MLEFCHASDERSIRLRHPGLTESLRPLQLGTEMRPECHQTGLRPQPQAFLRKHLTLGA